MHLSSPVKVLLSFGTNSCSSTANISRVSSALWSQSFDTSQYFICTASFSAFFERTAIPRGSAAIEMAYHTIQNSQISSPRLLVLLRNTFPFSFSATTSNLSSAAFLRWHGRVGFDIIPTAANSWFGGQKNDYLHLGGGFFGTISIWVSA